MEVYSFANCNRALLNDPEAHLQSNSEPASNASKFTEICNEKSSDSECSPGSNECLPETI